MISIKIIRDSHMKVHELLNDEQCPHCAMLKEIETLWMENVHAWKAIEELYRRHLVTQNNVRGTDRFLNQTKHHG